MAYFWHVPCYFCINIDDPFLSEGFGNTTRYNREFSSRERTHDIGGEVF